MGETPSHFFFNTQNKIIASVFYTLQPSSLSRTGIFKDEFDCKTKFVSCDNKHMDQVASLGSETWGTSINFLHHSLFLDSWSVLKVLTR